MLESQVCVYMYIGCTLCVCILRSPSTWRKWVNVKGIRDQCHATIYLCCFRIQWLICYIYPNMLYFEEKERETFNLLTMIFPVTHGFQLMVDGRSACTMWYPSAYHCLQSIYVHNTTQYTVMQFIHTLHNALLYSWETEDTFVTKPSYPPYVNVYSSHSQSCTYLITIHTYM